MCPTVRQCLEARLRQITLSLSFRYWISYNLFHGSFHYIVLYFCCRNVGCLSRLHEMENDDVSLAGGGVSGSDRGY